MPASRRPTIVVLTLTLLTLLVGGAIAYYETARVLREVLLRVDGMVCGYCEEHIHKDLIALPGVKEVVVSQKTGTVRMVVDGWSGPSSETIIATIREAGYEVADEQDLPDES